MPEKLLSVSDVANWLQVSQAWVRDHSTRKYPRLPAMKMGGLLRFCPSDVQRFIEEQRTAGARR